MSAYSFPTSTKKPLQDRSLAMFALSVLVMKVRRAVLILDGGYLSLLSSYQKEFSPIEIECVQVSCDVSFTV